MTIKTKKPFVVQLLRLRFPNIVREDVVMVWGKNVYSSLKMNKWLMKHEEVHVKQQKNWFGGLIWWIGYIFSVKFRLKMEIEAHRVQYQSFCRDCGNLKLREAFLDDIAKNLSGLIYNNMISLEEAKKLIREI